MKTNSIGRKKIKQTLRFDFITLFPRECEAYAKTSILGRAQKRGVVTCKAVSPRDFAEDAHRTVDSRPFGGGPGMVMMLSPIHKAIKSLRITKRELARTRIILTSARGKIFTHNDAQRLSRYKRIVVICGRYEGVDERVAEHVAHESLSIGDYVLAGGELAALVIMESVSRFVPSVLNNSASLEESRGSYPVYTRPRSYSADSENWDVPEVLFSGHARLIDEWRRERDSRV